MAGTREEERQHFKKQTDRRGDFNPKRKNSLAGKNKDLHATTPLASGTVTSPTTPTSLGSTASNASFSSGPALPSSRPIPEHVPVNNFNSAEISLFLNNGFHEAVQRYHSNSDPDLNELLSLEKPDMYKPPTEKNAWGNKLTWGQAAHLMANGNDFFTELRKSIPNVPASNAQPATAK
ncbi:26267_t:CDS:2 [Dentiscutata erythropus]|uniref:26267_t:CDS:1 n=1 Tax=Dentiscutata erythropus TaxID=1348616 RepID=A0A9N9IMI3_9GLOM|nr:26267_t:CDS:2 [Dentiscutata erythropus]